MNVRFTWIKYGTAQAKCVSHLVCDRFKIEERITQREVLKKASNKNYVFIGLSCAHHLIIIQTLYEGAKGNRTPEISSTKNEDCMSWWWEIRK